MADLYLLPCACGENLRVGRAQAGQSMKCACGKEVAVPTLRGLRDLQPAPADAPSGKRGVRWTPIHGAAFSGGLVVATLALLVFLPSLFFYVLSQNFTTDESGTLIEYGVAQIDQMSVEDLLTEWDQVLETGLGPQFTPPWVLAQKSMEIYMWRMQMSGAVGVIAIAVALGAVFLGRR